MEKVKKIIHLLRKINICKTLYFNFHYFKPSVAFYLPVLIYKRTILYKMEGEIVLEAPIKTGMLHLGGHGLAIQDNFYSRTIWNCSGRLIINGERNHVGRGSKICIDKDGCLTFGGNLMITGNSEIVCSKKVEFGKNCLLSWDILVMDNDFHRITNFVGDVINSPQSIVIGNHVWIGCRCTILKGVTIADNNVIASNSVVTRDIMDNNCIIGGVGKSMGVIKHDVDWLI